MLSIYVKASRVTISEELSSVSLLESIGVRTTIGREGKKDKRKDRELKGGGGGGRGHVKMTGAGRRSRKLGEGGRGRSCTWVLSAGDQREEQLPPLITVTNTRVSGVCWFHWPPFNTTSVLLCLFPPL